MAEVKYKVDSVEESNLKMQKRLEKIQLGAFCFLCGLGVASTANTYAENNTYYVLEEEQWDGEEFVTTEFVVVDEENLDLFVGDSYKKYNIMKKMNTNHVSILKVQGYNDLEDNYNKPTAAYEIVDSSEKLESKEGEYRFVFVAGENNYNYITEEEVKAEKVSKKLEEYNRLKEKERENNKQNDGLYPIEPKPIYDTELMPEELDVSYSKNQKIKIDDSLLPIEPTTLPIEPTTESNLLTDDVYKDSSYALPSNENYYDNKPEEKVYDISMYVKEINYTVFNSKDNIIYNGRQVDWSEYNNYDFDEKHLIKEKKTYGK